MWFKRQSMSTRHVDLDHASTSLLSINESQQPPQQQHHTSASASTTTTLPDASLPITQTEYHQHNDDSSGIEMSGGIAYNSSLNDGVDVISSIGVVQRALVSTASATSTTTQVQQQQQWSSASSSSPASPSPPSASPSPTIESDSHSVSMSQLMNSDFTDADSRMELMRMPSHNAAENYLHTTLSGDSVPVSAAAGKRHTRAAAAALKLAPFYFFLFFFYVCSKGASQLFASYIASATRLNAPIYLTSMIDMHVHAYIMHCSNAIPTAASDVLQH